jgi:hypothetical protein
MDSTSVTGNNLRRNAPLLSAGQSDCRNQIAQGLRRLFALSAGPTSAMAMLRQLSSRISGMKRPRGLALTVMLMAFCNVMLWAIIDPLKHPHYLRNQIAVTVLICIGFGFIWFYWLGKNWARNSVMVYSALCILNLRIWGRVSVSQGFLATPAHLLIASRAVLGLFLLYWLNTPSVRQFFKRNSEVSQPTLK